MRKHYTKAQRAELIDLVTSGQATTRRAAARLGVAESAAYYWLKRARESLALAVRRNGSPRSVAKARPMFARLIPTERCVLRSRCEPVASSSRYGPGSTMRSCATSSQLSRSARRDRAWPADLRGARAGRHADGIERLGALVREKMRAEPRSRALFVFVGKSGHSMKVLTWDGTGTIVVHN